MYYLSDEDSASSLTIYYKAHDNNSPEMNESSAESRRRTKAMEKDIARFKAERTQHEKATQEKTSPGTGCSNPPST
jgi:hypothetical protein